MRHFPLPLKRYKSFNRRAVWSNVNKKQCVSRQQVGCQVTDTEVLRPYSACNNFTWKTTWQAIIRLISCNLSSLKQLHICYRTVNVWKTVNVKCKKQTCIHTANCIVKSWYTNQLFSKDMSTRRYENTGSIKTVSATQAECGCHEQR